MSSYNSQWHHEHNVRLLTRAVPLIQMLGWEVQTELPRGRGPADGIATRGSLRLWLQMKTRTPDNNMSPSVAIPTEHLRAYERLRDDTNTEVVIISDDLMCDTVNFIVDHAARTPDPAYVLMDTRRSKWYGDSDFTRSGKRYPMRYRVQDFFEPS